MMFLKMMKILKICFVATAVTLDPDLNEHLALVILCLSYNIIMNFIKSGNTDHLGVIKSFMP